MNPRSQLLADAETLVNGDRNIAYGPPSADFDRTAAMWTAYLGQPIANHDVAALMALLKISRIRWSPQKHDHWADLAGYAACGYDCIVTNDTDVIRDGYTGETTESAGATLAKPPGVTNTYLGDVDEN